jgi:flavin-dependent dehydrogenase
MKHFDLIIAGAGPAGLSLARELAQSSMRILLLDCKKNAADVRYTTSGSFIDPDTWNIPVDIVNPIDTVCFCSAHEKAVKHGKACVIDRRKLLVFLELQALCNKNLQIKYNAAVCGIKSTDNKWLSSISFRQNGVVETAEATVFADCTGINSTIARRMGLVSESFMVSAGVEYTVPLISQPHSSVLLTGSSLEGGYGWIFPLNAEKAIAGYGTLNRKSFPFLENRLKSMWKLPEVSSMVELKPFEKHCGALKTGSPPLKIATGNLVLIGDTAMQTNPIAGEGIRFVMDAAKIAAPFIMHAVKKGDMQALNLYEKQWKKKYLNKHRLADRIHRILKEKTSSDSSMDRGVRLIMSMSDRNFARLLSGDINPLFLLRAGLSSLLFPSRSR